MKENGTDEPDPTICIVPLYSAPKIPLVSHLLTIPAPKIVDINWSLPKDGCETPTSGW